MGPFPPRAFKKGSSFLGGHKFGEFLKSPLLNAFFFNPEFLVPKVSRGVLNCAFGIFAGFFKTPHFVGLSNSPGGAYKLKFPLPPFSSSNLNHGCSCWFVFFPPPGGGKFLGVLTFLGEEKSPLFEKGVFLM